MTEDDEPDVEPGDELIQPDLDPDDLLQTPGTELVVIKDGRELEIVLPASLLKRVLRLPL